MIPTEDERDDRALLWSTVIWCVVFFVLYPAAIAAGIVYVVAAP